MAVELNVNRRHWVDVPVPDDNGNWGTIKVEFRVPKDGDPKDISIIDLITGVDDLVLKDEDGKQLSTEKVIEAIKRDGGLASLVINAYRLGKEMSIEKQRTLLLQSETS